MAVEVGGMGEIRYWCGGRGRREKQKQKQQQQLQMMLLGFGEGGVVRRPPALRRLRRGGTVRLGNRRPRRLLLLRRRLARWSAQLRWRVVVELLGPLKRALMDVVAGRELARSQHLPLPFLCSFPLPLA